MVFPVCSRSKLRSKRHECTLVCYVGYRHRLKRFLRYLIVIRPFVSTLKFALDIGDPADGYNELLTALVKVWYYIFKKMIIVWQSFVVHKFSIILYSLIGYMNSVTWWWSSGCGRRQSFYAGGKEPGGTDIKGTWVHWKIIGGVAGGGSKTRARGQMPPFPPLEPPVLLVNLCVTL